MPCFSRSRRAFGLGLLALLWLAIAATAPPSEAVELSEGTTSLRFAMGVLEPMGLEPIDVSTSAAPLRSGAMGFRVEAGSTLDFDAPGDDLERIDAAELSHQGGFALRSAGTTLRFDPLRISAAAAPYELAISGPDGQVLLLTRSMHARLNSAEGRLRIANADVVLASEFAARIGRPELAGHFVGVLDASVGWAVSPPAATTHGDVTCTPNIGPPIDLELIELDNLRQGARQAGVRVAIAPRAELRNLGPGDAEWGFSIHPDELPDDELGAHPFLALAFYRLDADGVLEQLGRSDVKHAFFSINTGCSCAGDNVMYAGCSDTYGTQTNLDPHYLAPRDKIAAFTRSWTRLGSHFDGSPVDDERDHGELDHDDFEHRLVVQEADLSTPGARYFYEAWYLAAGDTQLENSLGHREVAPSLSGSTWLFPEIDPGLENGSMLDVQVDPSLPPTGSDNRWLDTGMGRLQLAVRTEDLGAGVYRYVYSLMNFDFDRQISSFTIPLNSSLTVSATGFSDSDANSANDWVAAVGEDGLHFTAPAGNALDWGGLYSFRAEIDASPVANQARLGVLEAGAPMALRIPSLGPTPAAIPALEFGALAALASSLCLCAWLWSRRNRFQHAPTPGGSD